MHPYLSLIPVWVFSLAALWLGAVHSNQQTAIVYVGLGALGVSVANALMFQHRRIAELESRLAKK